MKRVRISHRIPAALLATAVVLLPAVSVRADDAAALEFFEKKVRPVLVSNCYTCHSAETKPSGGLRVDDRHGLLAGGNRGPAVVPGDPDKSLLLRAVTHTDKRLKMPPEQPLTEEEIAVLKVWIENGAVWPAPKIPADLQKPKEEYEQLRREHWAWQPLLKAAVPEVQDTAWPRDELDRFILSRLEREGLAPVGDADRRTLIRRLTFDLTGVPPTPDEVDAFVNDQSVNAVETVVDRLLASPAFGERWGRHWLDVARYAESTGSARNLPYPHAWRYRDYVIDAFNKDKPYDDFIREQIAGDLLPAESEEERREHLIATGFLALGVKDVNQRFKVRFIMDNIDEQIDTVTRSVLALTVSCARCHDHKFDPVPTSDYYALAGIFHSTDHCAGLRNQMGGSGLAYYQPNLLLVLRESGEPTPEMAEKIEAAKKAVQEARAEFERLRDSKEGGEKTKNGRPKRQVARQKWNRLQAELTALTDPASIGEVALGVREAAVVGDTEIRLRGEAEKLGPVVPRGFLSLLEIPDARPVNPQQSGRLELAEWLTSPQNPLTQRVIVNRVWKHLFGRGLVTTVDNFGVTGDTPTHPELLDHLATRFVADGWSIKRLVRTIVLSRTYQLSSETGASQRSVDPDNRLLWRHSPRRLDAEEIRDAMLASAGVLDQQRPHGSPAQDLKVIELRNNGPEATRLANAAASSRHRSVYLPLLRGLTPTSLEVFDFAEQGLVTGQRDTTTVAPQALYLLNDPLVRSLSETLARRLLQHEELDDAARIGLAWRLTLLRSPSSAEVERTRSFLVDFEAAVAAIHQSPDVAIASRPAPVETAVVSTASVADPENPDDPVETADPVEESPAVPSEPRTAAWAAVIQSLLGSAEFRYLQ